VMMILLLRARCSRVGGVAQLGEHLLCKQGVIGSIPIVSTSLGLHQLACIYKNALGSVSRNVRNRFDHAAQAKRPGCVVVPFACPWGELARVCGLASGLLPGWVALFFVRVNQVLVRLWARVIRGLSLDRRRVPSFG
jgi:hypothetical protein